MLKNLLAIIALSMGGYGISAAAPDFSEADWARVPYPGEFTVEEVMELFAGPIEKGGREWTLDLFDNEELKNLMDGGHLVVKPIGLGEFFAHQPFFVDSLGRLRYEQFLISATEVDQNTEADPKAGEILKVDDIVLCVKKVRLPISMQLTEEDLNNPIIKAVQLNVTFQEQERLDRDDMENLRQTK
ncbi:hypothetical protein [Candidatus Bodocaedibacter vickermanii]|uniref:Flagellar assembly factor FliW n=1 Tax=Candidatus Bodocaedibacter vickermanii TaxID=2741701 RepID=A0A7L9RSX3_9PROT|nr:hypothetical protein CPBP_00403 [Candidatus Paracaedibacteraceae bacterium 'Lake Konstanz']